MTGKDVVRNVFVIDTSVLIDDPKRIFGFKDGIVVIPFPVLEELDRLKSEGNGTAAYAREAIRTLNGFREKGQLHRGVEMSGGGIILVDSKGSIPGNLKVNSTDNFIISIALKWKSREKQPIRKSNSKNAGDIISVLSQRFRLGEVYLVTRDINLKLKADACGVLVDPTDDAAKSDSQFYSGIVHIPVGDQLKEIGWLLGDPNKGESLSGEYFGESIILPKLFPNQCCIFENEESYILAIYKESVDFSSRFVRVQKPKNEKHYGIKPRNIEQAFAYALLMDREVRIVTLSGIAGSGKTLMALLAGLQQQEDEIYQQVLVYRSNTEIGESIGYLPGDLEEKFKPWAQPIMDALELLKNGHEDPLISKSTAPPKMRFDIDDLFKQEKIKIDPINYIRGRSFHHKFVVVDESQNFKPGDLKKVITRVGRNTKIILTGDVEQIDSLYLDRRSNGLTHVIERMKGQLIFGHVTLSKSERSDLAEIAARIL